MRILTQHLANCARTLREQSQQCGIAKHSDNIGAAREALTKLFLRSHLPATVSYLTGEIFDCNDQRSGQIDLILHPTGAPRLNIIEGVDVVFADWVLAVLEVKSSLTTASFGESCHLKSALDACVRVKHMPIGRTLQAMSQSGTAVTERSIPYMIFAFGGPTVDTLREKLFEYQSRNGLDLIAMPDLITVLDRGYYLVKNNGWLIDMVPGNVHYSTNIEPEGVLLGIYAYLTKLVEATHSVPRFTPLSNYLRNLTEKA